MFHQLHKQGQGQESCEFSTPYWVGTTNVTAAIMDKRRKLVAKKECGFEDISLLL
jgi:hypothetical protein